MSPVEMINQMLAEFNVIVRFGTGAFDDLSQYPRGEQEKIIALIVKRGMTGPLIRPDGLGEPLHGELYGFIKIKPKKLGLRIIYRPVQDDVIIMEIIAIGPRDKKQVYNMAAKRITEFKGEMK